MNFMRNIYFFSVVVAWLAASQAEAVCLVTLPASRFLPDLNTGRDQIRLFMKKNINGKAPQWFDVPFQIDPLTENERLVFPADAKWKKELLDDFDRIRFRDRDLGDPKDKTPLPCGKVVYEIRVRRASGWGYGYLTSCADSLRPIASQAPIKYSPDKFQLETSRYLYQYHTLNQMLFKSVFLEEGGKFVPFLSESRLDIFADVKNFFNLHFDDSDIESKLEKNDVRELGAVAVVSFYLKILFFKIKLSLTTDVNFFEDAASIPMYISLPISGKERLNKGSGILYSFRLSDGVVASAVDMPVLQDGYNPSSKKWCDKNNCRFSVSFLRRGKALSFYFKIPVGLAKEGFFPQFVRGPTDLRKIPKILKHMPDENFVGFFFATNGLSAGQHPWDLGIQFGEKPAESISCRPTFIIQKI